MQMQSRHWTTAVVIAIALHAGGAPGKPKAAPKTPQKPTETFPVEETAEPKPPGPIAKREPDDMPPQRVEMIVPVQFLII